MTRECPYCEDVLPEERFQDHLTDCMRHLVVPPPPGRFRVTCSNHDCLLFKGVTYPEIGHAEILAWAHESRMDDLADPHHCTLEDLNPVQPSKKPEAATGVKEAANG